VGGVVDSFTKMAEQREASDLTAGEKQAQALRDTAARARSRGITEEDETGVPRERNSNP
jgi:hypothetical protein